MFPSIFAFLLSNAKLLFIKNKYSVIVTGLLIVTIFLFLQQRKKTQQVEFKLAVAEQNINALNDTVRVTKDKAGKIEYDKFAFITDKVNNLEKLNKNLYTEVKKIKGKVGTVIQGEVKIVHDTIPLIVKGEIIDSNVIATFNYDSVFSPGNYRKFNGYTRYNLRNGNTIAQLNNDEIGMKVITGIKNLDKGKPEIFFKSDYPNFSITNLDGAVLDPNLFNKKTKQHLITLGINVGWTPVTYEFNNHKFNFNATRIGGSVGININLIELLRKR